MIYVNRPIATLQGWEKQKPWCRYTEDIRDCLANPEKWQDKLPGGLAPREQIRGLWEAICTIFHDKCAYCEAKLDEKAQLSWFRPRDNAQQNQDAPPDQDHYYWLRWEWSNMYPACWDCFNHKRFLFPIGKRRARPGTYGVENLYEIEDPLLLDPCFDNPDQHLEFNSTDGSVCAKVGSKYGQATINTLGLNRPALKAQRHAQAATLQEAFHRAVALSVVDPAFAQEETRTAIAELHKRCAADQPFAGMQRQLLHRWLQEIQQATDTGREIKFALEREAWQNLVAQLAKWRTSLPAKAIRLVPAPEPIPPYPRKSWAVLVGINQYDDTANIDTLRLCVNDVTAIHQQLAQNYAGVRLLTDNTMDRLPTFKHIYEDLSLIAHQAGANDLLLFQFSGHGIASEGEGYLLARDTSRRALKYTSISLRNVREIMASSAARAKIIILDACHSGVATGRSTAIMTPEFMQHVYEEAAGIAILSACTQGEQSYEPPDFQNGVFTHFLLEAIQGKADFTNKGFVTITDASEYVTDKVKQWSWQSKCVQTPTLQREGIGDIILNRYAKSG